MKKYISFDLYVIAKGVLLLLLLIIQINDIKAQIAVRGNLALPLSPLVYSEIFGGGFDIGVDTKVLPNKSLRISAHSNKLFFSKPKRNANEFTGSVNFDQIQKYGLRLGFKSYLFKEDKEFEFNGIYLGFFTDIMYASRKKISYEYQQGVETNRKKLIDKKDILPAGGLNVGYTLDFNNIIVEPNFEIGAALNTRQFISDKPTAGFGDWRKLDQIIIHLTTWHFELHVGYVIHYNKNKRLLVE